MSAPKPGAIPCLVNGIGKWVSLLMLAMMAIIAYEVIARYLFNAPTTWVWLVCKQLFGVFVVVAGSYTLVQKSHIRIEMLYVRFPRALKELVRWLTLACAASFLGALTWKSGVMGLSSLRTLEKATGVFRLPLYPLKLFIPLGVLLFLVAALAMYLRREK